MLNLKSNKYVSGLLKRLCISGRYELPVLEAASKQGYVETFSNKADGLHFNVLKLYPEEVTEVFFRDAVQKIKSLHLGLVEVIADITEEDYYGKSSGWYIHSWTGEAGVVGKFRFFVAGIKFRNKFLPFYIAILPVGSFKAEYLGEAVKLLNKASIKISRITLDRGFYSGDIIDTITLEDVNYLIFAPKKKLYKYMLESILDEGTVIQYEIKYSKNKTGYHAKTNLALVKNVKGYDWVFATNIILEDVAKYVGIYKPRWNIETMFRVHDEARIKSKSTKAVTRLFYFTISMLLLLVWNLHAKTKTTFKLFTTILYEQKLFQTLKIPYTNPI